MLTLARCRSKRDRCAHAFLLVRVAVTTLVTLVHDPCKRDPARPVCLRLLTIVAKRELDGQAYSLSRVALSVAVRRRRNFDWL